MTPREPKDGIRELLHELCVDLGFCLPPHEQRRLREAPPADADGFTDAVFTAEGLDPGPRTPLWHQVRERIDRHMRGGEDPAGADRGRATPDDPRRATWTRQAFALVRQDVRDEEEALRPRLRDAFDDRAPRRIGAAWEAVRATAPTRPHPGVPRRPPGNALRGVPLSVLDRLRDLAPGTGPRARRVLLTLTGAAVAAGAVVLPVRSVRRRTRA
ncbi:hypothetical protein [Streptomyces caelestis]|uniref:hypothetical protein n=1 Tax=Streptomyces caelestis TaxID=36816 RepID=UPI003662CC9E